MNIYRFLNKNLLSFAGCIIVLTIFNFDILDAEILSRSRPEPEIRERIHKILRKTLREEYIDIIDLSLTFWPKWDIWKSAGIV